MSTTKDNSAKFMLGFPVLFQDVCAVKSPLIKDIAAIGVSNFYRYVSFLTIQKPNEADNQLKEILKPLSDFEYLVLLSEMDKDTRYIVQSAFQFFTSEKATIVSNPQPMIVIGDVAEKRILNETNYYNFSRLILQACAMLDSREDEIELLDSDDEHVRAIKLAMLKGRRDREAAKRRQKDANDKGSNLDLTDLIGSLPVGVQGYTLADVGEMTYYAFQDQLKRMGWKEEFSINTRASLAGAKLDKNKLAYWMKAMTFK